MSGADGSRHDPLAGGGEMGHLMRSIDWSRTPVGPVDTWPQSLRTALSILLETGFPMYIAWGPDFTQFYNDGYRPILGSTKHPAAMGISTRETFAEIWDIIGPMFQGVMEGRSTTVVDFLLPLDRFGFSEECYFVFSYSPIREESGGVGGVLVTVTETTARVLGARRLATLRALAADTRDAREAVEACRIAADVLGSNAADVPFTRIYLVDRDQRHASLVGTTGTAPETAHAAAIELTAPGEWPLGEVVRTRTAATVQTADGVAVVLPVMQQGADRALGVLVAGVSPRLVLDDEYRSFLSLVAAQIGTAIASAEALEEARARAEALAELDRAKTLFFSNVSHEFRTPLTLILGPLAEALGDDQGLPAETRVQLIVAHRNSLRLLKLVNTLLEFSRIEAGRVQARFEAVDMCSLVADLVSTFRSAMDRAGLSLDVECEPWEEGAYVDRDMFEQIVLNLLSNAFKFTLEGGVTVSVRRRGDAAELVVRDTGVGIPREELPRVFERFHRVEGTRGRTYEGSGIGLALVHELVKLHAGQLTVESELGLGTTFTIAIPIGVAHLPAEQVVAASTRPTVGRAATAFVEEALRWLPPAAASTAPRTDPVPDVAATRPPLDDAHILVVDDNADMREYARRLLAERWSVETSSDGEDALRAARRRPPDVIVTDVMMPRLDGFGLIRELRADPALRPIPVIVLSARAGDDARIEGLGQGADDYLAKPFAARDLLAHVEAQLLKARMRAVERLQARRMAEMFAHAPVAIAVVRGPEHLFELANPMYVELVGRPVLGRTIREAFPDLADQGIYGLLDTVRATRTPYVGRSVPLTLNRGGGDADFGYFDFVYQPLVDDRGDVEMIVVVVHEVTALVNAREAAERSNRLKDEFLATLSHELRTPLNAVLGYTQMLRAGVIKPERHAAVMETIERNALAQQQLIEDVLDVSRIVTGKLRLDMQSVDLAQVTDEAVETVMPAADAKGVRMATTLDRDAPPVAGDPQRLQQVIWNLLSNAVKFTPRGGHVEVSLRQEDGRVELTVSDTGEGIAPDFLPFLFERFRQADSALSRTHGGLGLGLAISRHLVEAHGGRINASSPGKGAGTTVRVELPLAVPDERPVTTERDAPASELLPPPALPLSDLSGIRVLLVDDDPDALEMAREAIVVAGGSALTARDAVEALAVLDRQPVDVAVLDIGMPDVDGYDLLRRIRQRPPDRGGRVPAAALTAYAQVAERARSLEAGFQMHLGKPVRPIELVAAVRALADASTRR